MNDPFKIEGPAQIGVSGGRTSAYQLRRILDAHGGKLPPDVHLTFQNTGKEMEETLVFLNEVSTRWGVPITWMEYDRVYGDESRPRYKLVDFATASRNSEPFEKFLRYYDEYRRIEKDEPPWPAARCASRC
jgi:3'-phosphoadenosine 5'-phosphosulfate sulfotransferase (PAPS reductase)/FAD synthetase